MNYASNSRIHPTALLGDTVVLEDSVEIGPYTVIVGNVHIGRGTRIGAHCAIGYPAQHTSVTESLGTIYIGQDCVIREYVSIHASIYKSGTTRIGNQCYIMNYCHIAHDVTLEHNIVMNNNVNLGGHSHIEHHAVMMALSAVHQWCRVGAYSSVTPYSGTRQDLPPFCMFVGQPGQFAGLNIVGLRRAGVAREALTHLDLVTKLFYQDKLPLQTISLRASQEPWGKEPLVEQFLAFITASSRGVSRQCLRYRRSDDITVVDNAHCEQESSI